MTQAAVDSLAIKHFIKEPKAEILSREVKITLKTDSSAGKTMASRLGISKKSKHIELRHLWIQDVLSEGVMSLEKVGTHQSGICHYHCDHQSKEKTGSRKESIKTIKTDETFRTSISLYLHPVQCSICYMYFHCVSFHVIQSIIISIILLDSRLELSRVTSLSSVASVVSFSCHIHLQNGSSSTSARQ